MERFRILDGLPGTGPPPEYFSDDGHGRHREELVVEFFPGTMRSWVGNFRRGSNSYSNGYNAVLELPNERFLLVVAGGHGYVIDPEKRSVVTTFGENLHAWSGHAIRWTTRQISWNGIRDLKVDQNQLRGLSWNAPEDREEPFSVDLKTGEVEGGGHTGETKGKPGWREKAALLFRQLR